VFLQVARHETRALAIQRVARGCFARRRATALRTARAAAAAASAVERAAVWAQRRTRTAASRRRFSRAALAIAARRLQQRTRAALWAQAVARGRAGRRAARAQQAQRFRAAAAGVLNLVARGMLGRLAAKRQRALAAAAALAEAVEQASATFLQAWGRGTLCRWRVSPLLAVERLRRADASALRSHGAATAIQCLARRRFAARRLAQRRAVAAGLRRDLLRDAALEAELSALAVALEEALFALRLQCFARRNGARGKVAAARAAQQKWGLERALRRRNKAAAAIQVHTKTNRAPPRKRSNRSSPSFCYFSSCRRFVRLLVRLFAPLGAAQALYRGRTARAFLRARRAAIQPAAPSTNEHALARHSSARSSLPSSAVRGAGPLASSRRGSSRSQGFGKLYDDSAQAWYWYNAATGEAVWTDPALE
jgi:hypothetical protein